MFCAQINKQLLNRWINYKQRFYWMYGKHIYEHYDKESVEILKYEILFM